MGVGPVMKQDSGGVRANQSIRKCTRKKRTKDKARDQAKYNTPSKGCRCDMNPKCRFVFCCEMKFRPG